MRKWLGDKVFTSSDTKRHNKFYQDLIDIQLSRRNAGQPPLSGEEWKQYYHSDGEPRFDWRERQARKEREAHMQTDPQQDGGPMPGRAPTIPQPPPQAPNPSRRQNGPQGGSGGTGRRRSRHRFPLELHKRDGTPLPLHQTQRWQNASRSERRRLVQEERELHGIPEEDEEFEEAEEVEEQETGPAATPPFQNQQPDVVPRQPRSGAGSRAVPNRQQPVPNRPQHEREPEPEPEPEPEEQEPPAPAAGQPGKVPWRSDASSVQGNNLLFDIASGATSITSGPPSRASGSQYQSQQQQQQQQQQLHQSGSRSSQQTPASHNPLSGGRRSGQRSQMPTQQPDRRESQQQRQGSQSRGPGSVMVTAQQDQGSVVANDATQHSGAPGEVFNLKGPRGIAHWPSGDSSSPPDKDRTVVNPLFLGQE